LRRTHRADQVEEKLRNALLENVGTLMVFRVGPASGRFLAPNLPRFEEEDLIEYWAVSDT